MTDFRRLYPGLPVCCYSIVARDAATGDLGVATQSRWFSIGTVVPWAEAGAGAVASQGFSDGSYGALGLEAMRTGAAAPDVLARLLAADGGRDRRQVAMVDSSGRVAVHTGPGCFPPAGHASGDGWAVVASMARSEAVWREMGPAFESAKGPIAERFLAALDAAEAAGGELRGKRSAGLVVVRGASSGKTWLDRVCDLRVEDSPEPLLEMRRLLELRAAFDLMGSGQKALERGDLEGALAACREAGVMLPDDAEMAFWPGVLLVLAGRLEEALPHFRSAFRLQPSWVEITRTLPSIGLLPDDPDLLARILAEA